MLDDDSPLTSEIPNWGEWLEQSDDPSFKQLIRGRTFTGRPCGDDNFVYKIGLRTGRDLSKKKRGPTPPIEVSENPELSIA